MKTAEEIKAKIKALESELFHVELTEGYVARINKCVATGAEHEWRLDSCEQTRESTPVFAWDRSTPVGHVAGRYSETAKLRCCCGVSLTFQEG